MNYLSLEKLITMWIILKFISIIFSQIKLSKYGLMEFIWICLTVPTFETLGKLGAGNDYNINIGHTHIGHTSWESSESQSSGSDSKESKINLNFQNLKKGIKKR